MGWFSKGKRQTAVLALWSEFKSICVNLIRDLGGIEDDMIGPITAVIDSMIKNSPDDVFNMNMNQSAHYLTYNTAVDLLTSGQYHISPGVLGLNGEQMRKFALKAIKEIVEKGYLSEEEANESVDNLNKDIRQAG